MNEDEKRDVKKELFQRLPVWLLLLVGAGFILARIAHLVIGPQK